MLSNGKRKAWALAVGLALSTLILAAAVIPNSTAAAPQKPLYVALIWHNHQPLYKDPVKGVYLMPWVRMHAVKDYYDMAAMLENYPKMQATFNLVPSLLYQLDDYAYHGAKDTYMLATEKPADQLTDADKEFILRRFFDANWDNLIRVHPRYWELLQKRGTTGSDAEIARAKQTFTVQDFRDLQVWFNLAWLDPDFQKNDPAMAALVAKGRNFSEADKQAVLAKHLEIIRSVVPEYRKLMEKGQIEVTTTPFYHPILPLINSTDSARIASPNLPLPQEPFSHPEDVQAQLAKAVRSYEDHFGRPPAGLWPSEQAVGQDILPYVEEAGFQWLVTSEGILEKSLGTQVRDGARGLSKPDVLYQPYLVKGEGRDLAILFRDIVLSDKIGFSYSGMPAEQAVDDFIGYLHRMQQQLATVPGDHVATIALDGENCWEYYPNDGKKFLSLLYERLSNDPLLKPVTVQQYLKEHPPVQRLATLRTGSWIGDNLETWIGEEEENKAWDYLNKARQAIVTYDVLHYGEPGYEETLAKAYEELYAAEGSDWFWWYGSDQDSGNDAAFDDLFRTHLLNIYAITGQQAPDYLYLPIIARTPARPASAASGRLTAVVDGLVRPGEWDQGLQFPADPAGTGVARTLYAGNDAAKVYLRVDFGVPLERLLKEGWQARFYFSNPRQLTVNALPRDSAAGAGATVLGYGLAEEITADFAAVQGGEAGGNTALPVPVTLAKAAGANQWQPAEVLPAGTAMAGTDAAGKGTTLELAVPFGLLDLRAAESASLTLVLAQGSAIREVLPVAGPVRVQVPEVIGGDLVFECKDPTGDDHGPGSYTYPGNAVFTPGVFDLTRFQVFKEGNDVVFKIYLAGEINNVWNSPIGLSVQTIDIYIDKDHKAGSGQTKALGGRRVQFAPESAWEDAIWVEGWNQKLFTADGQEVAGANLRVSVDTAERSVTVRVAAAAIGTPQPGWGYQVFVLGQEGYPESDSLRVREVKAQKQEWRFGGGDDGPYDPNVIDMLAPEGTTQEQLLSAYDVAGKKLAVVPMVYAH